MRQVLFPLVTMVVAPPLVIALWIAAVAADGSLLVLVHEPGRVLSHWPWPTPTSVAIVAIWFGLQALLLRLLPGRLHPGPITPMGNRPVYRLNGVAAHVVTHALFFLGAYPLGLFPATLVYDRFGEILATTSLIAFVGCLLLYAKGRYQPSSSDAGSSGHGVWDFFWGVELHPRVGKVDLKQLVNCRVAMMGWSIVLVSFAAAQHARHGALSWPMIASAGLGLAYLFKFFLGEHAYFATLDIMHDRFGFYVAWGILAWLPGVYTLAPLYLVDHPEATTKLSCGLALVVGTMALLVSSIADYERHRVRADPTRAIVWGRRPVVVEAAYQTGDGRRHSSLLLASGFWGVARHVNYALELVVAFCWTVPCGFEHLLPWLYPLFLAGLLVHRAQRDELRCRGKYGKAWETYCRLVPWRFVPGVY